MILVKLSEITNNLDSRRIPLNSKQRSQKESKRLYPYIGANNIMGYIDEYIFNEKILCVAEDGGSWSYNQTCAKIYNQKCWVNNHAHVLTPKDNLCLEYLMYYLNYTDLSLHINGATRGKLTKKSLNSIKIPLPSLSEQKRIAGILDEADKLRQLNQQLISKYNQLTQSLFLDMFGDPVTNPNRYPTTTIGEQCLVKGGKRVPKGEKLVKENTGFPYIKAGNIKKGKINTNDIEYLKPLVREKLKRYTVQEGVLCMTVVGVNIGDVGIVPKELHLANLTENANKLLIKDKSSLLTTYLCYALQSKYTQQQINKRTMAVGVPKLALFRIQQLQIIIPSFKLQNEFEKRIQIIEQQKAQAQEALQKSQDLFNSLLQKAFKGEV